MFNRYSYALNDPINLNDPNGECPICIPIAIFIVKELAAEGASRATGGATDFLSVRRTGTNIVKAGGRQLAKRRAEQLAKNRAQGKKAEALTEAKIGDDLAGKQVTLESSTTGKRARMDFVKKDGSVVETKSGDAKLSSGQQAVKDYIDAGNPVIPRGNNATDAGLVKDKPVTLPSCSVDRPC